MNFTNKGFTLKKSLGSNPYWDCTKTIGNDMQSITAYGITASNIFKVEAMSTQGNLNFLAYVASLPYAGSKPSQAAAWVAEALDAQSSNPYARAMEAAKKVLPDDQIKQVENVLARWESQGAEFKKGNLYRTHIDVDPDTLLDWDKPLSEQGESVQAAWRDYAVSPEGRSVASEFNSYKDGDTLLDIPEFADPYGETMYKVGFSGMPDTASGHLANRGIPGIRYRDGMSRTQFDDVLNFEQWLESTKGTDLVDVVNTPREARFTAEYDRWLEAEMRARDNPTYNYVMFDDKPISIVERGNASPELLAGVATATGAGIAINQAAQDVEQLRSAHADYASRRQSKREFWDARKRDVLDLANSVGGFLSDTAGSVMASSPTLQMGAAYASQLPGERMMTEADIPLRAALAGAGALANVATGEDLTTVGQNAQQVWNQDSLETTGNLGDQAADWIMRQGNSASPNPLQEGAAELARFGLKWIPQVASPI
jgi:hypothetical protein